MAMKHFALALLLSSCLLVVSAQAVLNGDKHWELAQAYYATGDWELALGQYVMAIEANRRAGLAIPYYWHSSAAYTALLKLKDYERALPHFSSIITGAYPLEKKEAPLTEAALICYRLGCWDEFMRYALQYEEMVKDPARQKLINDLLANRYYELGKVEKALSHARRVGDDFWITKRLRPREINMSFRFRFRELIESQHPMLKNEETILVEIPLDSYYQRLLSVKSKPAYTRLIKRERMNWLEFRFPEGFPETLEIDCSIRIDIVNRDPLGARAATEALGPIAAYAHEARERHGLAYDLDNPLLAETLARITGNKPEGFDRLKALSGWMDTNILHPETLDARGITGYPDVAAYTRISDVLVHRLGDCVQRPGLFTAMARLMKIPARILLVFVYNGYWDKPEGFFDGAHGLPEVYDPVQKEWIQTDIIPEGQAWANHHYSIPCQYYESDDKPYNYLNLMFLTQDAIQMGDADAGRWSLQYVD